MHACRHGVAVMTVVAVVQRWVNLLREHLVLRFFELVYDSLCRMISAHITFNAINKYRFFPTAETLITVPESSKTCEIDVRRDTKGHENRSVIRVYVHDWRLSPNITLDPGYFPEGFRSRALTKF